MAGNCRHTASFSLAQSCLHSLLCVTWGVSPLLYLLFPINAQLDLKQCIKVIPLKSSWNLRHLRCGSQITVTKAAIAGALQYLLYRRLRHSSDCADTLLETRWIIHEKSPSASTWPEKLQRPTTTCGILAFLHFSGMGIKLGTRLTIEITEWQRISQIFSNLSKKVPFGFMSRCSELFSFALDEFTLPLPLT